MRSNAATLVVRGMPRRQVASLTGAVLVTGAFGSLVFSVTGLRCPFRTVGLACPGCGCGRAVGAFLEGGAGAAFRAQPTATALVLVLCLVTVVAMLPLRPARRWQGGHLLYSVAAFSGINLLWQLASG